MMSAQSTSNLRREHHAGSSQLGVTRRAKSAIEDYIEQRPDSAVGLALVAGAVVGFCIGAGLADSTGAQRARHRKIAEGVGERMMSMLERSLPQSLSNIIGGHK